MGFAWRTCDQLKQQTVQCSGMGSMGQSQAAQRSMASAVSIRIPLASHSTPGAGGVVLCSPRQALLR